MDVTPERSWFGTARMDGDAAGHFSIGFARFPGSSSASWSTMTPLNGRDRGSGIYVPGFVPHGPRDTEVHIVSVSPGFFETLGIPVLGGRSIGSRDDAAAARIAVLNRTAARFYFGDTDPLGKRIAFERKNPVQYEIVGVVNDVKHESVRAGMARFVYLADPADHRSDQPAHALRARIVSSRFAGEPGAAGDSRIRSVAADRQCADHGSPDRGDAAQGAAGDDALGGVRRPGTAARVCRPLRHTGLHRCPPHARAWDSDGAWRDAQRDGLAGAARRTRRWRGSASPSECR